MPRITVPVPVRWSDVDGYGHVNNAAIFTLLEEARVATFWETDDDDDRPGARVFTAGAGADSHTLLARQEIEYVAPLPYGHRPVPVDLWVARIGGASLEVHYEVYGPQAQLCARAASVMVMVEAASGKPRRLSTAERTAVSELVDEPLTFRRR